MIKVKTKADIRKELADKVRRFLSAGGEIEKVQQGVSGKEIGVNIDSQVIFCQEKQSRTPVTNELNSLDARKHKKKSNPVKSPQPKRRIIYDDFGEPLREVWDE
ncbi:hypothetical protein AB835_14020 [Candidatus Endobugula sertula]|uniref:Transcriptional regulator SutA RNAP-binding domain-containing protein n=1 Tax=Candidatus Endobugula sertula TaxID=62101 RepID=A0A1D2QLM1_9GAMM|nr:hypothetical protein AB835_14020 [Candidatus Endobugula sertula]